MHLRNLLLAGFLVGSQVANAGNGKGAPVETIRMLSHDGAMQVLDAASIDARRRGVKVSIAVVDAYGHLLAFERVNNAMPVTIDNAIAKARTAAEIAAPSKALQDQVDHGQTSYLAIIGLAPLQGGFPITVGGTVVGGIGTSGASADIDEQISKLGSEAL